MRTPLSHKNCPSLWLALPPQMMILRFSPRFCSFKFHKYDNYDKALYIVSSYHYSNKANLKASPHLFRQAELTLPPFSQYTKKDILKYISSTSLNYN